jgi:hypothetical protein
MLAREEWTKGTGTPPAIKGFVWFTDGSKMREGPGAVVYGQSRKKAQLFSRKICYNLSGQDTCYLGVFYEIQFQNRPEKYVSICSDRKL